MAAGRQTNRPPDRQTEIDKGRQTYGLADRRDGRQDRQTDRHRLRHTDMADSRQTTRPTAQQIYGRADSRTGRQTDRQVGQRRETERHGLMKTGRAAGRETTRQKDIWTGR